MSLTVNAFQREMQRQEFSEICETYCDILTIAKIFEEEIKAHNCLIKAIKASGSEIVEQELAVARQDWEQHSNHSYALEIADRRNLQTQITNYANKYNQDRESVSRAVLASPTVRNFFKAQLFSSFQKETSALEPAAKKRKEGEPSENKTS